MEVLQRTITITLNDDTKIYDGIAHKYVNNDEYGYIKNYNLVGESLDTVTVNGISQDLIITVKYNNDPINVGTYTMTYDSFVINNGKVENYNIVCEQTAKLVIEQRTITITLNPDTKNYDGITHVYRNYNNDGIYFKNYNLVGQSLDTVTVEGVSEHLIIKVKYDNTPLNAGTYTMTYDSFDIENGLATNYKVVCEQTETLTINRRDIYVDILTGLTHVYDNTEYKYPKAFDEDDNYSKNFTYSTNTPSTMKNKNIMVEGELLEIFVVFDQTPIDAGTYTMTYSDYDIYGDGALEDNYNIYCLQTETMEIKQRDIYVDILTGLTKIYDGLEYTYPEAFDASSKYIPNFTYSTNTPDTMKHENVMVEGQLLEILVKFDKKPVDVGTYTMEYAGYNVSNGKADNYNIHCEATQTMEISQRIITIKLNDDSKIYDGIVHEYRNYKDDKTYFKNYELVGESLDTVTVDGISQNLVITVKYDVKPLNVGTYQMTYKSFDIENGNTKNYKIICEESSELVIEQRTITITLNNDTKVYDGIVHSYVNYDQKNKYFKNYNLVGESLDTVSVDKVSENLIIKVKYDKTPLNVDSYTMTYDSFDIENGLASNYKVICEQTANLTITKRVVAIEILPSEKVYDGNVYDYVNYDEDGKYQHRYTAVKNSQGKVYDTVTGENLIIDVKFINELGKTITPKDAGTYTMIVDEVSLEKGSMDNYKFEFDYETTVVIKPRDIYVNILENLTHIYDGLEYTYPTAYDENGKYTQNFTYFNSTPSSMKHKNVMVEGQLLEIFVTFNKTPIDAGNYTISYADSFNVYNGLVSNYNIICKRKAKFEVLQREIEITLNNDSKIYDGIAHAYRNYKDEAYLKNYNLVGESLDTVTVGGITQELVIKVTYSKDPINAGKYTMTYDSFDITNGNKNNYKVTCDSTAELIIKQRTINITLNNDTKVYDGKLHSYVNYDEAGKYFKNYNLVGESLDTVTVGDISENLVITVSYDKDPLNVGKYKMTYKSFNIENGLNSNYIVNCSGEYELEITKRIVAIQIVASEKVYDGKIYDYVNYIDGKYQHRYTAVVNSQGKVYDTVPGENLIIDVKFLNELGEVIKPEDVGTYKMKVDKVSLENGLIENYQFELEYETTIEIKPRDIYVDILTGLTKVYDGLEYTYPTVFDKDGKYTQNFTYSTNTPITMNHENKMVDGQLLEIIVSFDKTPLNAGTYTMTYADDYNVTNGKKTNYIIHCDASQTMTIERRTIEITLNNDTKVFDGLEYAYPNYKDDVYFKNYNLVEGSYDLVGSDQLVILPVYSAMTVNAGSYDIIYKDYDINNGIKDNYNIVCKENAKLTVNPKLIEIILEDTEVVYYGKDVTKDENYEIVYSLKPGTTGTVLNDKLILDITSNDDNVEVINVGKYQIKYNGFNITNELESDITGIKGNYKVVCVNESPATITVVKREVNVQIISGKKEYDGKPYDYINSDENGKRYTVVENSDGEILDFVNGAYLEIDVNFYEVVNGNYIEFKDAPTNVGKYYMRCNKYVLINGDISNYNILIDVDLNNNDYTYKTIEITKRNVYVILNDDTKTYDGEKYVYSNYDEEGNYFKNYSIPSGKEYKDVIEGEQLLIKNVTYYTNKQCTVIAPNNIGAGTYYMLPTGFSIIKDGVEDGEVCNYNINFYVDEKGNKAASKLVVNKRNVTISVKAPDSWTYDGTEFRFPSYYVDEDGNEVPNYNILSGEILSKDTLTITSVGIYEAVSLTSNKHKNNNMLYKVSDAGIYVIDITSTDSYNIEGVGYDSYNITIDNNQLRTFEIKKVQIDIEIDDIEKVFDNTEFDSNDVTYKVVSENGFVGNDKMLPEFVFMLNGNPVKSNKNANIYDIIYSKHTMYSGNINNYDISFERAKLTVEKRDVVIQIDNYQTEKTGYELSHIMHDVYPGDTAIVSGSLAPGDYVYMHGFKYSKILEDNTYEPIEGYPIEVGKYLAEVIVDGEYLGYQFDFGNDNYNVEFIPGIFEITEVNAEIEFKDNQMEYSFIFDHYDIYDNFTTFNSGHVHNYNMNFNYEIYEMEDPYTYRYDEDGKLIPSDGNNVGYYKVIITGYTVGNYFSITKDEYNEEIADTYPVRINGDWEFVFERIPLNRDVYWSDYYTDNEFDGSSYNHHEIIVDGVTYKNNEVYYKTYNGNEPKLYDYIYLNDYHGTELHDITFDYHYVDANGKEVTPIDVGSYYIIIDQIYLDYRLDDVYDPITYDEFIKTNSGYNFNICTTNIVITKREVTVQVSFDEHTYDGKEYNYKDHIVVIDKSSGSNKGLLEGDSLENLGIKFYESTDIYHINPVTPLNVGTYYAVVDTTIENNNYQYKVLKDNDTNAHAVLNIVKRNVVISLQDVDATYNGKTYNYSSKVVEYDDQFDRILKTDIVEYEFAINKYALTEIIDAGRYNVQLVSIKINGELAYSNVELNNPSYYEISNYDIEIARYLCNVEINQAELKIETFDYISYYTGEAVYGYNTESLGTGYNESWRYCDPDKSESKMYNVPSSLVSGHTVSVVNNKEVQPYVVNKNSSTFNYLEFVVTDSLGNDVTDNYIINYTVTGKIKVYDKFDVKLDDKLYYSGDIIDLTNYSYSLVSETDNETLSYSKFNINAYVIYDESGNEITNIRNIGKYKILITDYSIYDTKFNSDSSLWKELEIGTNINIGNDMEGTSIVLNVEVLGHLLKIKAQDVTKVYDGKPLTTTSYKILYGDLLDESHEVIIETLEITDVERNTENYITDCKVVIKDADGNILEDVSYLYTLVYSSDDEAEMKQFYSELRITARKFKLTTPDYTTEYNGQAQSYVGDNPYTIGLTDEGYGLLEGHTFILESLKEATNVTSTNNRPTYRIEDEFGNDVTTNYSADAHYGKLTITKRKLTITTNSMVKVYNGLPLIGTYTYDGLIDGHEIVATQTKKTKVGIYENNVVVTKIYNEDGNNVLKYYDVEYVYGTISIINGIRIVYNDSTSTAKVVESITGQELTALTFIINDCYENNGAIYVNDYVFMENGSVVDLSQYNCQNQIIDGCIKLL